MNEKNNLDKEKVAQIREYCVGSDYATVASWLGVGLRVVFYTLKSFENDANFNSRKGEKIIYLLYHLSQKYKQIEEMKLKALLETEDFAKTFLGTLYTPKHNHTFAKQEQPIQNEAFVNA